jgi:hypothetical protein
VEPALPESATVRISLPMPLRTAFPQHAGNYVFDGSRHLRRESRPGCELFSLHAERDDITG